MKSFAAQYVYIGQGRMLKKQVVQVDNSGNINSIQPFEVESASTVFLNGVLCVAFCHSGNGKPLNTDEAAILLHQIWKTNKPQPINDLLNSYTTAPDLEIGSRSNLWCIESVDLKQLLLKENISVYSVFS